LDPQDKKDLFWKHVPNSIEGYSGRIRLLLDLLTDEQLDEALHTVGAYPMKVKFYDIEWDTDGDDDIDLPEVVVMDVEEDTDIPYRGADLLSDEYGFCVYAFDFDILVE
jgi:hypothetical protein